MTLTIGLVLVALLLVGLGLLYYAVARGLGLRAEIIERRRNEPPADPEG